MPFYHFGGLFEVKSDVLKAFLHFGGLFIVKSDVLNAFLSLLRPFYSQNRSSAVVLFVTFLYKKAAKVTKRTLDNRRLF